MAYNLESLIRILEQLLHPDHEQRLLILDLEKKPQLESLLKIASSLKHILDINSTPAISKSMGSLEIQIRDSAHKAEDIIESHIVDQMHSKPGGQSFTISPPDLQQVIEVLDSAMDEAKKINIDENNQMAKISEPDGPSSTNTAVEFDEKIVDAKNHMAGISLSRASTPPTSADPPSSTSINVVGLEGDLKDLKYRLTGSETKLEIVAIVGMGGIGKTTLARTLYNDDLINSHFPTRAWITISQDYNERTILLGLLNCIVGKPTDEMLQMKSNKLALILHQNLYSKKYLIVIDDIWGSDAWDKIRSFFPKTSNGSRIMLTTRELNVANYVDSSSQHHEMHLLDDVDSWELLRREVFGKEVCPTTLERVGRSIASSCRGLPLAIHVIGGLLPKAEGTKDIGSTIAENDEQLSNIFSYSYRNLPNHLKPCFLYVGAFPEDFEIMTSTLIRLWVADGFLKKSNGDETLEEEAEHYLKALIDRNLLSIEQRKSNGKPKSCRIHDLLRNLCVKKAVEEKFLDVKNWDVRSIPEDSFHSLRRVSVHPSYNIRDMYDSEKFMSLARAFLCIGYASRVILSPLFFALRLLRVLDILDLEFPQFPREILRLVNLRYLAFWSNAELPSAISSLRNLQTLIVWTNLYIPSYSLKYGRCLS